MTNERILYVCQEITPYLPETEQGLLCRNLPQMMQEAGAEIRLFTPRYGLINERRNQLHEVIRLSGMNLIIDDNDHQLIIKVASIPGARLQVYFIDNEDFFQRKGTTTDAEGVFYADNDERAIFFARGVLETVKKLRWSPTIVHCHGWMSAVIPGYLKRVFKDDPIFSGVKIVVSLYDQDFPESLSDTISNKLKLEGIKTDDMSMLDKEQNYTALMKFALQWADGVVYAGQNIPAEIKDYVNSLNIKTLQHPTTPNPSTEPEPQAQHRPEELAYAGKYYEFYEQLSK